MEYGYSKQSALLYTISKKYKKFLGGSKYNNFLKEIIFDH